MSGKSLVGVFVGTSEEEFDDSGFGPPSTICFELPELVPGETADDDCVPSSAPFSFNSLFIDPFPNARPATKHVAAIKMPRAAISGKLLRSGTPSAACRLMGSVAMGPRLQSNCCLQSVSRG